MDGLMFICGGRQPRKEKSRITNNCYIFDPVLWQLKEIANMNAPRTSYPLVACGGYVYAIGGACNYPNAHVNICQTIERYSLHDNCWKTVGYLPEPVYSHTAVSNGNLIYVYGGMNRSRQVVASFFSFDTLTGDLKTLPSPDFVRIGCTLASVEHRLILMRPGKSELRVFDTITEEWVETALVGFQEPTKGGFDVVSATGCIIPVLFKEPMLLFLGGYILSAIEAEEPSNFFVHLDFYRGKMQGQIVPLPELNHNVTQPLCVTIPIPSFRLEAMRNEITDGTQE